MADNVPDSLFSSIASVDFTQPTEPYNIELTELEGLGTRVLGVSDLQDEVEELEQALQDCLDECPECPVTPEDLQACEDQVDALTALITPAEDVNGNGQWQHTTLESTGCRAGSPIVSCAFTDKLSVEYVSGTTFKFRRVNSAGCCGVDGGVTVCAPGSTLLAVFTSPDLTGEVVLGLSGDRGATSESNKNLSDGTYYVFGRGTGIFKPDCSGFYDEEPYQLLGTFTVSGATLVRTFNVIVTAEG